MFHPPKSLDIAPWGFSLFSYLKTKLEGIQFIKEDHVTSAVIQVIEDSPGEMLGREMGAGLIG
jgi:hypothetical protein